MTEIETQKLPRGVSHNVGGRRYVKEMPLDLFKALPEKTQGKIKAGLKKEVEAAEAVAKSNESQKSQTDADQEKVKEEKAEKAAEKKPGK